MLLYNLIPVLMGIIGLYFLYDMVKLMGAKQFSLGRSRTYAVLLGLVMIVRIIYGRFTDTFFDDAELPSRGMFVVTLIGLATLYTLGDLVVALLRKKKDAAFTRRKLTFFLFMFVLLVFYLWMKNAVS